MLEHLFPSGIAGTNFASKYLRANSITLLKVREEIVKILGKGDFYYFSPKEPPLTEDAQKALDWALDEKLKSGMYILPLNFNIHMFVVLMHFCLHKYLLNSCLNHGKYFNESCGGMIFDFTRSTSMKVLAEANLKFKCLLNCTGFRIITESLSQIYH